MVYSSLLTQSWTYLVVVELTGQVDSSGNTVSIKNNDSTQTGFLTVLVVASDCIWNVNDNFFGYSMGEYSLGRLSAGKWLSDFQGILDPLSTHPSGWYYVYVLQKY
jgi:hypothetical protein